MCRRTQRGQEIAREYMVQITVQKSHLRTFQRALPLLCIRPARKCDIQCASFSRPSFFFFRGNPFHVPKGAKKFEKMKETKQSTRRKNGYKHKRNREKKKESREDPYPVFLPVFGRQPALCNRQYWPL